MSDELKSLYEAIAAVEKECGLDWRFSYSKLTNREGAVFEIELSCEDVWRGIPERLAGFSVKEIGVRRTELIGGAGLTVRLTHLAADTDHPLWVVSSVADVRRENAHSAELLTQLIMGEVAYSLKVEGDWFLVRLPDGYHGWIRSWYVRQTDARAVAAYAASARAMVEGNVGYVLSGPDEGSLPVSEAVAGTRLVASPATAGYREVRLPGGKSGFLRSELLADVSERIRPDRARLVRRAQRFLGIPYLWGGTTPKGFDCSGFVKRVFLMEGVALPRDSDKQALAGVPLTADGPNAPEPGDLLFFGDGGKVGHVGISLGGGLFIHAYGEVRINSLLPGDERYDEKFAKIFLFARTGLL
ncbi:MAG TPA: SH3 domain-containing C40 family peptidase [Candidatus Bathyarchaeia archaeon]|nr:SH3 domain-containing C40 family peptidase [Candidatus Bathyarchaeia archaeon]